jgi:hypothetical protein
MWPYFNVPCKGLIRQDWLVWRNLWIPFIWAMGICTFLPVNGIDICTSKIWHACVKTDGPLHLILRVIRLKGNLLTGNICRSWGWVLIIFKYFIQVSQSLSEPRQVWSLKYWRQLKGKSAFVMMDFSFGSIRHWRTPTYPGGAQIKNAMHASKQMMVWPQS